MANGCSLTYGIAYEDTFSPVAKVTFVRLLIFLSAIYSLLLYKSLVDSQGHVINIRAEIINMLTLVWK